MVGQTQLTLSVGNKQITHSFTVVQDFTFPVLLGSSFLRLVCAIISYENGTITFGGPNPCQKATLYFRHFTNQDGTTGPVGSGSVLTVSRSIPAVLDSTVTFTIPISSHHANSPSASDVLDSNSSSSLWQATATTVVNDYLSSSQRAKLCTLIDSYNDVFAQTIDDLGRFTVATHRIDTGDHFPVIMPPYRLPPASREEVHKQIRCLMRNGIVQESCSPWASPVVLADKSDAMNRFCVDYRQVNACTKRTGILSLALMIVSISYWERTTSQVPISCPATGKFLSLRRMLRDHI